MPVLYVVAQIGLVLFMFIVGVEFRIDLVASRARAAASITIAGTLVPFALGAALAWLIYSSHDLFGGGIGRPIAALFLGAAMSITAFPVLARIIHERGLSGTNVGTLALASGSMADAAAWCILALILAMLRGTWSIAALAGGGGIAYTAFTLLILRPLLARTLKTNPDGDLGTVRLSCILALLMLAAWLTDRIGVYSVFGAFILGVAMPRGQVCHALRRSIEPLTTALLVPLFFVYSGLNTSVGLLDRPAVWALALLVLLIACLGKGLTCWAAARVHGESQPDSIAIGALMNARGLMELIILNIGLEAGVITPTLFSIMVLMAIATTFMATPILQLTSPKRA
jgi:Kef-type K+ transport system membrane component KefB